MIREYPQSVLAKIAMRVYEEEYFGEATGKTISLYAVDGPMNKKMEFEVIRSTPHSNPEQYGFNAFLLKEKGQDKYILAFRGTDFKFNMDSVLDIASDLMTIGDKNMQEPIAIEFTRTLLEDSKLNINKDNLLLVGHSLGGILANQVGVDVGISGVAINSLGMGNLIEEDDSPEEKKRKEDHVNKRIVNLSYQDATWIGGDVLSRFISRTEKISNNPIIKKISEKLRKKHLGTFMSIPGINKKWLNGHKIESIVEALEDKEDIFRGHEEKEYKFKEDHFKEVFDLNEQIDPGNAYNSMISTLKRFVRGNTEAEMVSLKDMSIKEMVEKSKKDNSYAYAIMVKNGFVIKNSNFLMSPPKKIDDLHLRENARYIRECLQGNRKNMEKEVKESSIFNISINMKNFKKEYGEKVSPGLKKWVAEAVKDNQKIGQKEATETFAIIKEHLKDNPDAKITPLKLFSIEELVELAKNDSAYTYALEKGNSFAIEGGRYDGYICKLSEKEISELSTEMFLQFNTEEKQEIKSTLDQNENIDTDNTNAKQGIEM